MKTTGSTILFFAMAMVCVKAQVPALPVADNLVVEGVPPLPATLADEVKNYTEARGAALVSWRPAATSTSSVSTSTGSVSAMLISTRFANSNQLHYVASPGGMRTQLTFFDEPIMSATFQPVNGEYFLFLKDKGGDEFHQICRYDMSDKKITMLTDGERSQNLGIQWSERGNRIAYTSTRRNGRDRDVYIVDPLYPSGERRVSESSGGQWSVVDWAPDDSRLLLQEVISINESRLYLLDLATGEKKRLLPEKNERSTFRGVAFSKDGRGVYLVTNKGSEFNRLALYDVNSRKMSVLTGDIPWDVEEADLSKDGDKLAFVANENGLSKLYILNTSKNRYEAVGGLPVGVIGNIMWSQDSRALGITFGSYNTMSDVYVYEGGEIIRWTFSETGGMDVSQLQEPELITWKSFDGKQISGYLYTPPSRFAGRRPVIINIHGGPEGQARPLFQQRSNYYLNELGIAIIYPNVRGSQGYGKTFLDLDNGMKREESVRDIGALLDWIATQPSLDQDRIMVTGGSYGGYMTLAVSYLYSDKIRCSVDVVGISNFNTFLKNTEAYRRDHRRQEYGDERDPQMAAFFERIAPFNHTAEIRKPLLIIQGGNDPRVPYTESVQMKEKIKQSGGTVWFLMAKDEGHGFRKKNNVDFQFYSTIAFVNQFLLNGTMD